MARLVRRHARVLWLLAALLALVAALGAELKWS